jgi:hypothetical protein
MNATPPEANIEYSRGPAPSGRDSARSGRDRGPFPGGFGAAILAGGLLGALLLVVAEFTALFAVHTQATSAPIRSVGTGAHHAYAMVPIALLAGALAYGVWRTQSRPALLSIGVLSVISLLIALVGDLPDAHANGLVGGSSGRLLLSASTPSAGFYMETLGGVVLLITCVCGFLLLGTGPRLAYQR